MRLALIGDIHTYRLLAPPWRLLSKRALGMAHLWLKRQFKFRRRQIGPLLERVAAIKPDLLLLSGDLTTTALEAEFGDIQRLIRDHLGGLPVVAVPGNHDRYTYRSARLKVMERWLGAFMPECFPCVRPLGSRWHLLALDGARPRRLSARGEIGTAQLQKAGDLISNLPAGDGLVILCHYPLMLPPEQHDKPGHSLVDDEALQQLVAEWSQRHPVVFAHGHVHHPWFWRPESDGLERVVTINAGAPCMRSREYPWGQGFWEIDLRAGGPGGQGDLALEATHHIPQAPASPPSGARKPARDSGWITRQYR